MKENTDLRAIPQTPSEPKAGPPRSPLTPFYRKVAQDDGKATQQYLISCDEGWRESIVCTDMYDWAADWLVEILQGRPYAPGKH